MVETDCPKCGVAFDMGRNYCVELGCGVPTEVSTITLPKPKKRYETKRYDNVTQRFMSVRQRASKRELPFDLTIDFIRVILTKPCVYCGETGDMQLDRKVGESGYTMSNVVPACKRCNTVKSMYLTYEQMIIVAKALGWHVA